METVAVIGGGAAGLMAAGTAARYGSRVILIEKNNEVGKKLYLTGKGRCNFTNNQPIEGFFDNTVNNKDFLYSAFYTFTNRQLISFFNDLGVKTKVERGGRVFPESDSSEEIVKALNRYLHNHKVRVEYRRVVRIVNLQNENQIRRDSDQNFNIYLQNGEVITCRKVIIATGGLSYSGTGSTGDGYQFARNLGHSIAEPEPSLVPLLVRETWVQKTDNLTLKNISISLFKEDRKIYEDFGELTFTGNGLQGPVILSASSHMRDIYNNNYKIKIDLKPSLTYDKLDKRIRRDFKKYANKHFKNSLSDLLPVKIIPVIIKLAPISSRKKVHQINRQQRKKLVKLIKSLELKIEDYHSMERAIITSGGVKTSQINPQTMESKITNNLFFAGEIIDVDAYTGGYNLQIAFSTGYLAGLSCSSEIN